LVLALVVGWQGIEGLQIHPVSAVVG